MCPEQLNYGIKNGHKKSASGVENTYWSHELVDNVINRHNLSKSLSVQVSTSF